MGYERKLRAAREELYSVIDEDPLQNTSALLAYFMVAPHIPDALAQHYPDVFHIVGGMMQIIDGLRRNPLVRLEKVGNNSVMKKEEMLQHLYSEFSEFYCGELVSVDAEEL